jgi:hypothetical protein
MNFIESLTIIDVILLLSGSGVIGILGNVVGSFWPIAKGPLVKLATVLDEVAEVIEALPVKNESVINKLVRNGKVEAAKHLEKRLTLNG